MTRDKLVNIRLTDEEHALIKQAAQADSREVAVFIRLAAIRAAEGVAQKAPVKNERKRK